MYILKNSIQNIFRNSGRNTMVGIIIFVIILTVVIALTINNTASGVIDDYKARFGSEVFVRVDTEKMREQAMNNTAGGGPVRISLPSLSAELQLQLADSEYLKEAIAIGEISANNDDIRAIDQEESENDDSSEDGNVTFSPQGGGQVAVSRLSGFGGNFKLLGDSWAEFDDGTRALESGEFPDSENECLISTEIRDENNIQIGDRLSFVATVNRETPSDLDAESISDGDIIEIDGLDYTASVSDFGVNLNREVVYEMIVVGIYEDFNDEYIDENMQKMPYLNRRNEVLTNLSTLLSLRNSDENGLRLNVTYYLLEPEMLADFEIEARAKGLPDTFNVDTDTASYNSIVKPVLGLKQISLTFMFVVLGLGAIILLLLTSISIRERKYEIGVLRAMGMKKAKVALGLWMELLIITGVCLVIGIGAGAIAAQPISDILLESQSTAEEESQMTPGRGGMVMMGPANIIGGAEPLSELNLNLGFITILQIISIAVLLATLASLVSVSKITKYEPIKILMERN